jgi:hypothetical protein
VLIDCVWVISATDHVDIVAITATGMRRDAVKNGLPVLQFPDFTLERGDVVFSAHVPSPPSIPHAANYDCTNV